MRTIDEVVDSKNVVGFSPDFRQVVFEAVGKKASVSLRSGGKSHPWDLVISVSRELAREADWPGETHVVIGVSRNPTMKQIEIRKCPDTKVGARKITQTGRNFWHIKMPYQKDLWPIVPEIAQPVEVKIHHVDKERLVIDCQGIKATGMPKKREIKCKLKPNT